MTILKCLAVLFMATLLAACSIQSDVLLPDPDAVGDRIDGFPATGPFRLQAFDRDKGDFKPFATIDVVAEGERARYVLAFDDGTPNRLKLQARKMSDGNYLVRFTQVAEGRSGSLSESGLAFVTIMDEDFFVLTAIMSMDTLHEIFAGRTLPKGGDGADVWLDSDEQAEAISAWFAKNYPRLAAYKDYSQFRVAK